MFKQNPLYVFQNVLITLLFPVIFRLYLTCFSLIVTFRPSFLYLLNFRQIFRQKIVRLIMIWYHTYFSLILKNRINFPQIIFLFRQHNIILIQLINHFSPFLLGHRLTFRIQRRCRRNFLIQFLNVDFIDTTQALVTCLVVFIIVGFALIVLQLVFCALDSVMVHSADELLEAFNKAGKAL